MIWIAASISCSPCSSSWRLWRTFSNCPTSFAWTPSFGLLFSSSCIAAGAALGGPTESARCSRVSGWFTSVGDRAPSLRDVLASAGYVGMLVAFFLLNQPVNVAVASWTPTSMPSDWTAYRTQWEAGHAVAAMLSVVSLMALAWAYVKERQAAPR